MAERFRIVTKNNAAGEPSPRVVITSPKASDFKISRRRKAAAPPTTPKPYLKLLRTDFTRFLKVEVETMPVDGGPGALLWSVWTGGPTVGAMRGAEFVDSWGIIDTEEAPPGCVALASTRTPYAMWVETAGGLEWNAVKAIQRICGIRRPFRYVY